jgi:surfeit locus 1 family protein
MMRAGAAETRPPARRPFRFTGRGIAAAAFVLLIAAVCIRLGFWQLERQAERDALNAVLASALEQPPLDLRGETLKAVRDDPASYLYRQVRVEGVYAPDREVVLRGRALGGNPGVNLVTPLEIQGETVSVLVNRGWVPSPDASTVDPRPHVEPGFRSVLGILQPLASGVESREVVLEVAGRPVRTLQRLDGADPRLVEARQLLPLVVQQLSEGAPDGESAAAGGSPARLPPPVIDRGPHLGYAVQWFSFAAIAILGFGLMLHLSRSAAD